MRTSLTQRPFMQCRNALRRHASTSIALPSSAAITPYLWITEEHLSEAFARFVKVSKSSKRFGSNVPGPLEARKRQARRRMGFTGAESCQGTGLAEFGALFGAGEQRTGLYEWQPPMREKPISKAQVLTNDSPGTWSNIFRPLKQVQVWQAPNQLASKHSAWKDSPLEPRTAQETRYISQEQITASQSAFVALLQAHERNARLTAADISPLLDFLQSAEDAPRAKNLDALLTWLMLQDFDASVLTAVRELIISKHKLKTISLVEFKATLGHLCRLAQRSLDAEKRSAYHDTLIVLSRHIERSYAAEPSLGRRWKVIYRSLLRAIIPQAPSRDSTANPMNAKSLADALKALSILAIERNRFAIPDSLIASPLKDLLLQLPKLGGDADTTQHDLTRDAFAQILNTSREPQLAQTVMHLLLSNYDTIRRTRQYPRTRELAVFWLKCLHQSNLLSSNMSREKLKDNWATYQVSGAVYEPFELVEVLAHLEPVQMANALIFGWINRYEPSKPLELPDTEQRRLARGRHSNKFRKISINDGTHRFVLGKLQNALFNEFTYTQFSSIQDPRITLLLALKAQRCRDDLLLEDLIKILIRGKHNPDRMNLFYRTLKEHKLQLPVLLQAALLNHMISQDYARRALYLLLDCPDLSLSMVQGLPSKLTANNDPAWILVTIEETLRTRKALQHESRKRLPQNVVDLVSQLATCIATTKRHTASWAYNRVWRCYDFLARRSIRMNSSISKAMVQSGIIRALKTRSTLPNTRLNFILEKVRWYEGDDTATKLEEYAKLERTKNPGRPQPSISFRPEIDGKHWYRSKLLPRF